MPDFDMMMSDDATLGRGDSLYSRCNTFRLIMQGDGNAVLQVADDLRRPIDGAHDGPFDRGDTNYIPIWDTGTFGKDAAKIVMQGDGNLVVYDFDNKPLWASNTNGTNGAFLFCQIDGNLVIYDGNRNPVWSSGTNARR